MPSTEKGAIRLFYTYILRCKDNSLYTGIAADIKHRMNEHFSQSEKAAKYTRSHAPLHLEAVWESESRVTASQLEYRIKRITKAQKEKLIKEDILDELFREKLNCKAYKRIDNEMI